MRILYLAPYITTTLGHRAIRDQIIGRLKDEHPITSLHAVNEASLAIGVQCDPDVVLLDFPFENVKVSHIRQTLPGVPIVGLGMATGYRYEFRDGSEQEPVDYVFDLEPYPHTGVYQNSRILAPFPLVDVDAMEMADAIVVESEAGHRPDDYYALLGGNEHERMQQEMRIQRVVVRELGWTALRTRGHLSRPRNLAAAHCARALWWTGGYSATWELVVSGAIQGRRLVSTDYDWLSREAETGQLENTAFVCYYERPLERCFLRVEQAAISMREPRWSASDRREYSEKLTAWLKRGLSAVSDLRDATVHVRADELRRYMQLDPDDQHFWSKGVFRWYRL